MTDVITLTKKEVWRFVRLWKQTLLPPVITIVLYLMIFGKFIWDQISIIEGVHYIDFIFPWLLMMSVIMASYSNTSSSFFGSKFQNNIQELFVSPITYTKILIGFCFWWALRGLMVWGLVFLVWFFMIDFQIHSYFYMIVFLVLTSCLFSLAGLFNGIFAKSFDDIMIIPSFVITPLVYLWWVFYSTSLLSPLWAWLSQANPILYMVNGLRFAFIWISDVNIYLAVAIILIFIIALVLGNLYLLKKGYGIKS
jgi:ABC-2 type transport system permease protein